ncbi:hypothetical protein PHYBOEH_003692 [Phytophthora boehmeriae]|uniref:Uncharacterized protein n=1 Tax=Phytophthora boehmeriae TaxID=109152 RepID=A0A8T1WQL1_9STRA|nr:hypothetical protein PHYBOEH_003692 [Phytophthora boehmeriae]
MTHIETKDPFGFVGSHVVRRGARKHGEEHGWLTRYDDALDCYTLFVPGGGEPRLLPRGEVMKFLSAPNVELHSDDQDAFPPPVKDETTSRYLGVSLRRPRDESIAAENKVQEDLRGRVTCFLPFADKYQVEYEDGTTEHLTEAAVIDGMIALIKSPFFSSPSRRKTRTSPRRTRKTVESSEDEELAPNGRRKRRRVEEEAQASAEQIPTTSVAVVENGEHEEQKEDGDEVVEFNDGTETQPAPNILEVMNSVAGEIRPNSLEHASAPMEEPVQVDGGDVSEPDAAEKILESAQPTETTDNTQPIVNPIPVEPIDPMKKKIIPSYIIEKKPHEATEPLPKRAMAFELLRATLLNLLDRQEANKVKIPLQYDLLRNTDVRDRDAVLRFMKADGLIVLNHLLNNYAVDVLANDDEESNKEDASTSIEQVRERMKRDDELLFVLKVLAMMPVPEREQSSGQMD